MAWATRLAQLLLHQADTHALVARFLEAARRDPVHGPLHPQVAEARETLVAELIELQPQPDELVARLQLLVEQGDVVGSTLAACLLHNWLRFVARLVTTAGGRAAPGRAFVCSDACAALIPHADHGGRNARRRGGPSRRGSPDARGDELRRRRV